MYGVVPYYLGRSLIEFPALIVFTFIMDAICYYIIGLNDYNAGKFFIFVAITILDAFAGNALGLWIGSMFPDPKVANAIAPAFLIPLVLFSGFFINRDTVPDWLGWIEWVSPFRYGLEGKLENEYTDSHLGTGELDKYGLDLGLGLSAGLYLIVGLFIRSLGLISLKIAARKL